MAKIRLFICEKCGSVDEMPAYEGHPSGDYWLKRMESGHMLDSGTALHGQTHVGHIEQSYWLSHKEEIVNEMAKEFTLPGAGAGLGQTYYDVKSNYSHDAMQCWRVEHNRTKNCQDYMSSKKKVMPDTRAERKSEGMDYKNRPGFYLCELCPYHQVVQQRKGSDEFGYNYNT